MLKQKYVIVLSARDIEKLNSIISKGVCSARSIKRAQILLNLNDTAKNKHTISELAEFFTISATSIINIKKSYLEKGVDCIFRKNRKTPPVKSKITGEVEAHLIALACHNPPAGYSRDIQ